MANKQQAKAGGQPPRWAWCGAAERSETLIVSASEAWQAGRSSAGFCKLWWSRVRRREILIMPVHARGGRYCLPGERGSLYLLPAYATHVRVVRMYPCAPSKGTNGTKRESFKRFPSPSPPRARADLISLTHGSLRACSDASDEACTSGAPVVATGSTALARSRCWAPSSVLGGDKCLAG